MYVRLAFAVAAHLEPEILIVDEVLAVGDAEFQKKCLGKMHEVAGGGRTVLFVSHNMASIASLCETAMLLKSGTIAKVGSPERVIAVYSAVSSTDARVELPIRPGIPSINAVSIDQDALRRGDFSARNRVRFTAPAANADWGPRHCQCYRGTGVGEQWAVSPK